MPRAEGGESIEDIPKKDCQHGGDTPGNQSEKRPDGEDRKVFLCGETEERFPACFQLRFGVRARFAALVCIRIRHRVCKSWTMRLRRSGQEERQSRCERRESDGDDILVKCDLEIHCLSLEQ